LVTRCRRRLAVLAPRSFAHEGSSVGLPLSRSNASEPSSVDARRSASFSDEYSLACSAWSALALCRQASPCSRLNLARRPGVPGRDMTCLFAGSPMIVSHRGRWRKILQTPFLAAAQC
jgi:hypothetical protein